MGKAWHGMAWCGMQKGKQKNRNTRQDQEQSRDREQTNNEPATTRGDKDYLTTRAGEHR